MPLDHGISGAVRYWRINNKNNKCLPYRVKMAYADQSDREPKLAVNQVDKVSDFKLNPNQDILWRGFSEVLNGDSRVLRSPASRVSSSILLRL